MQIILLDVNNQQKEDFKLHRENGRSDYLFVLFKSPAKVWVNGVYTLFEEGTGIIFDKYKKQSYFPIEHNKLLHDFIHFDLENDFERMIFADIPLGVPIKLSSPELITHIISDMKDELYSSFSKHKKEILSNLGTVFLYKIKDEIDYAEINVKKRENFNNLYSLRKEIYRNPQNAWSIDSICSTVCMSRSYFQHLYKEFFGVSCIDDVISARIAMAKSLLISSNAKVSDVAEKCGYFNTTHFIKQFKSQVGVSPDKFRNE